MRVAIIPARGGSKRIPRKNIKDFLGQPMIVHAIDLAKCSGLFEHVVVSTDDVEIAKIASDVGAKVPFFRPPELAGDLTPTVPVIAHAVQQCNLLGWAVSHACCIYPCVPLLSSDDLAGALALAEKTAADFVYPVTEYSHPVQRAMRRLDSGKMQFLLPEHELTRTQDLEKTYHDAGQFYWGRADAWLAHKRMHSGGLGFPIPHWRVADIDSEDDWKRAELIRRSLSSVT